MRKTIGSDAQADIQIHGRYIDAFHAVLSEENGEVFIEDLGSQFGTQINGRKIDKRHQLSPRDKVKIGTQLFNWQDAINPPKVNEHFQLHAADLFTSKGLLDWDTYRIALMILVGLLLLTPIAIRTSLRGFPYVLPTRIRESALNLDLLQYANALTIICCLFLLYILANLTIKYFRYRRS